MSWLKITLVSFLFLLPISKIYADTCVTKIIKINQAIQHYFVSPPANFPQWMNLSWLLQHLGKADVKIFKNINEYKWHCKNTNTFLDLRVDRQGNFLDVMGADSVHNSFVYTFPVATAPKMNAVITPPKPNEKVTITLKTTPPEMIQAGKEIQKDVQNKINEDAKIKKIARYTEQIKDYNKAFNTSIQNLDQLQIDMIKQGKNYLTNLKACHAGTYQYVIPGLTDLLFLTTIIKGQQNGLCITETSYQLGPANILIKCQITAEHLKNLKDNSADLQLNKTERPESESANSEINKDCQTLTNGLPQQNNAPNEEK